MLPAPSDRIAILINVLNPRLSFFFFAFLPQFVRTERTPTRAHGR